MKEVWLLSSLMITSLLANAQAKAQDTKIYISNFYSGENSKKAITLNYNTFYPFTKSNRVQIQLQDENKVTYVNLLNNSIVLNRRSLLLEDGDTIFTRVEGQNGQIVFTDKNTPLLFYDNFVNYTKQRKNTVFPSDKLFDSISDYGRYIKYCSDYFSEERDLIENYFGNQRPNIKEWLLAMSKNFELIAIMQPFVDGKIQDRTHRRFADSMVNAEMNRINAFKKSDLTNSNYFFALTQVNQFKSNVIIKNSITPEQYERLFKNATEIFSKDVKGRVLMSYLSTIAKTANADYKKVNDKIYRYLRNLGLEKAIMQQVDSVYNDFNLLSINLNYFGSIELMDSEGKKTLLRELLKDRKGVLLDFWATWCAPCIAELPYLDSVRAKLPDLKIISLSIDEDRNKWSAFLQKHKMNSGHFLLLMPREKNPIVRKYKITDVPRYMLYSQEGKCLSFNLMRPSDRLFITSVKELIEHDSH